MNRPWTAQGHYPSGLRADEERIVEGGQRLSVFNPREFFSSRFC